MARYTGPREKIARRFGVPLFGPSKALELRNFPPGQHGVRNARRKVSDYGIAMAEKQKLRYQYGLMEKQFALFVKRATATHETGENTVTPGLKLARLLEFRLDNIVYRSGFATTRALARQMVSHGHILVNGRRNNVASHQVKLGDVIAIREGSKVTKLFQSLSEKLANLNPTYALTIDPAKMSAIVKEPVREIEPMFDTQKVLEYYSR